MSSKSSMQLVLDDEKSSVLSKSRHRLRVLKMRVLLIMIGAIFEFANVLVMSKSITDTINVRNFSTTSYSTQNSPATLNEVNSKWMPMKSYVSHLTQLPPRQVPALSSRESDQMKFAESAPFGISVERDGSHPLDYLQQQFRLQQQHQQQSQQHLASFHQSSVPSYSRLDIPMLESSQIIPQQHQQQERQQQQQQQQQPCNKQKSNEDPMAVDRSVIIVASSKHEPSQPELTSASTTSNTSADMPLQQPLVAEERSGNIEDDEADEGDDDDAPVEGAKKETLNIDESVPAESYSGPQTDNMSPLESAGDSDYPSAQEAPESAQSTPESEAAERSEAEAAEAKEAEAADRSALDEQQQQQREIIKAQAESEAIAIKEQREALLRQQNLQQKMLLRRQLSDLRHQQQYIANEDSRRNSPANSVQQNKYTRRQMQTPVPNSDMPIYNRFESNPRPNQIRVEEGYNDQSTPYKVVDNPDSNHNQVPPKPNYENDNLDDELGVDYSIRRPQISVASAVADTTVSPLLHATRHQMNLTDFGDLLPAAQGSYGSLHGGHGDYYM